MKSGSGHQMGADITLKSNLYKKVKSTHLDVAFTDSTEGGNLNRKE